MSTAASEHTYNVTVEWLGNRGTGTSGYRDYGRDHLIRSGSKPEIAGSSDPAFRGDPSRWNPEELLVAALSACHKLWYLHLCAEAGVVVLAYKDDATGTMVEDASGGGHFTSVTLRPQVTVRRGNDLALAQRLHDEAHARCFLASSVNFPVSHAAVILDSGHNDGSKDRTASAQGAQTADSMLSPRLPSGQAGCEARSVSRASARGRNLHF